MPLKTPPSPPAPTTTITTATTATTVRPHAGGPAPGPARAGHSPPASKPVPGWSHRKDRALAPGAFNAGPNAGAIAPPLAAAWVAVRDGWPAGCCAPGALGLFGVALRRAVYR